MGSHRHLAGLLAVLLLAACREDTAVLGGEAQASGVDPREMAEQVRERSQARQGFIAALDQRVRAADAILEALRQHITTRSEGASDEEREGWKQAGVEIGLARKAALEKILELRGAPLDRVERIGHESRAITRYLDEKTERIRELLELDEA